MTHVTCRLTAKNRDQLRNPTLCNRVWTTFTIYTARLVSACETDMHLHLPFFAFFSALSLYFFPYPGSLLFSHSCTHSCTFPSVTLTCCIKHFSRYTQVDVLLSSTSYLRFCDFLVDKLYWVNCITVIK